MKFREDYKLIFPYNPDVLIIQETEDINTIDFGDYSSEVSGVLWIGENPKKGLGVICFNGYEVSLHENYKSEFKYVLPLILSRDTFRCNLIGVWTQKVGVKTKTHKNYIRQFKLSIKCYESLFSLDDVIICGDFNSNLIWENPFRIDKDHKEVIDKLEQKKIFSSYHHYFNEEQGRETRPTFYYHHKKEKPFHIDFCFLSLKLLNKIENVEVGNYDDWIKHSDHVPIIVTLKD